MACVAILLGVKNWDVFRQNIPEPDIQIVKECHLITAAGSKGRFVLPDSTVVWLNGGSRLVYPEKFSEVNRLVSIEGCGYFDVIPDEERPFIVQAGDVKLEVVGTSFNISNYTETGIVDVALLTGKVKISVPIHEEDVVMEPDHFYEYRKAEQTGVLREVDSRLYNQWINNKLVFDNRKLDEVFTVLEGWFNRKIHVSREVRQKYGVSFTVRDESIEEVLKGLSKIVPIRYTIEREEIRILPR